MTKATPQELEALADRIVNAPHSSANTKTVTFSSEECHAIYTALRSAVRASEIKKSDGLREQEAVTPNGRFMPRMLVIDADHAVCVGGRWDGWKFYRHPDGQWVSLEKLKEESLAPSSPVST